MVKTKGTLNILCQSDASAFPCISRYSNTITSAWFSSAFYRNSINIGLPVIVCKDLPDEVNTGDKMVLHMSEGTVEANGKTYSCTKLPEYMQNILNQGGLIASLNKEEK